MGKLFSSLCFALLLVVLAESKSLESKQLKPKIRFNPEGKFKIVNFADLHYGEFPGTDRGRAQDGNSTRVMTDILEFDTPDFVVFTGDLITGDAILINSTGFIEQLLTPLLSAGYRWASTYGNHDNGVATTREQIYATESKYENCYTTNDGTDLLPGLTNYYLPVYPSVESVGETPVLILWFFDSRGGFDPNGFKPSNVDEAVVNWFITKNAELTAAWGAVPALAFFHIPTIDYEDVQADIPNRDDCVGLVDEAVVPQDRDTLFMQALVNSGTVMTTFVGHDHGNAWCCTYLTLEICYNRHTGYGGYGDWTRGARVVELSEDILQRRNYIRLENGTIIDEYAANDA
jgi:hypothetical protein